MIYRLCALFLAGLVGACAFDREPYTERQAEALPPMDSVVVDSAPVRAPITGSCGMESLQHFVGQARTSVPASAVPDNYRVLGPDTITTMEYRAERLTIRVDGNDTVESIACG